MESSVNTKSLLKCLVLIVLLTSAGSEKFRCDYKFYADAEGWLKYQEIPATWSNARLRCALEGGILASPSTAGLMTVLVKLLNDDVEKTTIYKEIFTGIHATFSKGDYYSIDGVSLSEIPHKWKEYEPNNLHNDEDCLTMNKNGLLSDVNCHRTLPYYCFKYDNTTEEISDCGIMEPEYEYDNRTKSCYKFHKEPRTFSRAFFACSAEGGHLAIINNDTEADVIRELFAKFPESSMVGNFMKKAAFIGVTDWGEHGDWRTIHGQTLEEAGYAKFAFGKPNRSPSGGEYCGSANRNAELNDVVCDEPHAFICEKAPTYPAVCSNSDDT